MIAQPFTPPILQMIFHPRRVTGCTESREYFTSAMSLSFGSALIAASVTGFGSGSTARGLHGDPGLALLGGRIRIGFADHLADADDLLLVAGVIEEKLVALLHLLADAAAR